MSDVSENPNFTEKKYNVTYRKEDITGEPADNIATDLKKAAKLATLLNGYPFQQTRKR